MNTYSLSVSERSAVFWSASYNFVADPAFYTDAMREARDPRGLRVFYVTDDGIECLLLRKFPGLLAVNGLDHIVSGSFQNVF